ncbi:hypothetical protein KW456_04595 [Vibrio fluvialis]|nr:hypothetical protein [Vibrio fluvialis]
MTTIAYHHESKTIAWDSRRVQGNSIKTDSANKHHVINGVTFWLAGSVPDYKKAIDIYFGEKFDGYLEVDGIVLDGGEMFTIGFCKQDGFWKCPLNHNDAIGSGCDWAIAAMDFGKTPKQAIEYAKTRDCCTGGEVHELCLSVETTEQKMMRAQANSSLMQAAASGLCHHGKNSSECFSCCVEKESGTGVSKS